MSYEAEKVYKTRKELAAAGNWAETTVDRWHRLGMPCVERAGKGRPSKFYLPDVIAWLRERDVKRALERVEKGDAATGIDEIKHRKLLAQTELAELELAKARGDVAPVWQVERAMSNAFAEVKAAMRNLPGRAARRLIGESDETRIKAVLLSEVDQALEALADAQLVDPDEIGEPPTDLDDRDASDD